MNNNKRGVIALVAVVVGAFLFSLAAFVALTMAMGARRRSSVVYKQRMQARYAAEAGFAYAFDKLWDGQPLGAAPQLTVNGLPVEITVAPCGGGAPPACQQLKAKVTFAAP